MKLYIAGHNGMVGAALVRRFSAEPGVELLLRSRREVDLTNQAAVDALIGGYVEHSLHYLSKEMWRQAMAISTTQPSSPFGETYADLDVALKKTFAPIFG